MIMMNETNNKNNSTEGKNTMTINNTTLFDLSDESTMAMLDAIENGATAEEAINTKNEGPGFSDEFLTEEYETFVKGKGLKEYFKTSRIGAKAALTRREKRVVWWACLEKFSTPIEPLHIKTGNDCQRCQGTGMLQQFRHVAGGVCFTCNGTGIA